jgi:tetratricopeptide (TPR) repeat protein
VHELKPFAGNEFSGPPLTARQLADQEQFWDNAWAGQLEAWSKLGPAAAGSFPRRGGLQPVKPEAPRQTCRWFSALLNDWGVELQRAGNFPAARKRFAQALALNPENPAPPLNLIVNSNLLAGHAMDLSAARSLARDLAGIQQLARLMEISGALDEPVICALCGDACNNAGWPRQALAQLDRARQLAPDSVAPELMMAKIYARHALPDQVFGLAAHLRGYVTNTPAGQALDLELSVVEAKAWMDRTNLAEANRVLNTVLEKNPGNYGAAETVFNAFLAFGSPTNALALLDRMLAQEPDNIPALNNKAALLIQLQRAGEALPVLARALALTNQPAIRLNQALALMQEKKFPAAEQVYLGLRETGADPFRIEYGLAQIAEARQDTNTAVREYRLCLSNAPPDSANWQNASARLDALRKK